MYLERSQLYLLWWGTSVLLLFSLVLHHYILKKLVTTSQLWSDVWNISYTEVLLWVDWWLHSSINGDTSTATDSSGSAWSRGWGWLIGCWRGEDIEVIRELIEGWTHLLLLFIFILIFKGIYTSHVHSLALRALLSFHLPTIPLLPVLESPRFHSMPI